MSAPAPLAVYDAVDGSYRYPHHGPFREWAREQGIIHGKGLDLVTRIEIHLIDTLFARVTELVVDPDTGKIVCDPERDELPVTVRNVIISREPPQPPLPAIYRR